MILSCAPMKMDTKPNDVNKTSVFIYYPALNLARSLRGPLLSSALEARIIMPSFHLESCGYG